MKYKLSQLKGDLHTHSNYSLHASSTVYEYMKERPDLYIGITDHIQNLGSDILNNNIMSGIRLIRTQYQDTKIISGAEIDVDVPTRECHFDIGRVAYLILSYHCNREFNVDRFIYYINEYKPIIIGHPYRYVEEQEFSLEYTKRWNEVLEYAVSKGCIIEINECSLGSYDIDFLKGLNCRLSIGSDSHSVMQVGKVRGSIDLINTYLSDKEVVNFDEGFLRDLKAGKFNKNKSMSTTTWAKQKW